MRRDVVSGILLLVGALAGMVVMTLHPTAHGLMNPESFARQAQLNAMVHGVALASVPILFVGLLGLSRRLEQSDLAIAALVAYGFGSAAIISAAVTDGFVAPAVIERILAAGDESRSMDHALLAYTGLLNQGFAKVYLVASSVAILLWSVAILRSRRMARAAGVFGALAGIGVLLAFLAGQLRLDKHGFGIVIFAQSAWLIWVGILMCRPVR